MIIVSSIYSTSVRAALIMAKFLVSAKDKRGYGGGSCSSYLAHNGAMEMDIVYEIWDKMRHGKGPCTDAL